MSMPETKVLKVGERLKQLPDGSWYREDQYERRYARASGPPDKREKFDRRTETEKDRGRVSYSSFLRRLAGVTQVTSPTLLAPRLHTRESHSHKVSLVSREIAEGIARAIKKNPTGKTAEAIRQLGGIDITACETAGLSHDFGHPPFGHGGEVALNRLLRINDVPDGFEGNAQTFRILTSLDTQRLFTAEAPLGSDLTMVSLAAVLKYPRLCPPKKLIDGTHAEKALAKPPKFGSYADPGSDTNAIFDQAIELMPKGDSDKPRQTVEASIMDLADDLSYSTHDFEDFYKEGRIDFAHVAFDLDEAHRKLIAGEKPDEKDTNEFLKSAALLPKGYKPFFSTKHYIEQLEYVMGRITTFNLTFEYTGSLRDGSKMVTITSGFIEKMFAGIRVSFDPPWKNGPSVHLDRPAWHLTQILKTITRRYVVGTSRMATIDRSQTEAIETLYNGMAKWAQISKDGELPEPLDSYIRGLPSTGPDWVKHRAIGDYIAGLSDDECLARSRWIAGIEIPAMGSIH